MAVSAVTGTSTGQGVTSAVPPGQVDKQVFLQLLVAQLKNQDPLRPWDSEQFVTQLVQFTILEQLLAVNRLLEESLQAQELSRGAALIGRHVKISTGQGELVEGTVEKVSLNSGKVYLHIGGRAYELSQLVEVA